MLLLLLLFIFISLLSTHSFNSVIVHSLCWCLMVIYISLLMLFICYFIILCLPVVQDIISSCFYLYYCCTLRRNILLYVNGVNRWKWNTFTIKDKLCLILNISKDLLDGPSPDLKWVKLSHHFLEPLGVLNNLPIWSFSYRIYLLAFLLI